MTKRKRNQVGFREFKNGKTEIVFKEINKNKLAKYRLYCMYHGMPYLSEIKEVLKA